MSRAFVKEDGEGQSRDSLPERPVSGAPNYVTRKGLYKLREKVEALTREHARLRQTGDDFDKPQLAANERDLRYFRTRLESAIAVEVSSEPALEVRFGATVRTKDKTGTVTSFGIVGEDEADVADGKISWVSPLAKALMGSAVGDIVAWDRPAGPTTIEVMAIDYADRD